jgi:hypothetical protein
VVKGISSLNISEKRTILNRIQPCKVNLTHTLGTFNDCSEATVCLSFRVVEQATTSDLQDRTHTNCAGHTSVARLQNLYSYLPCRMYSHTSVHEKNQINRVVEGMSTCRADWLLGLPLYHISRYVASTFKRLATTTTHFDLNHF